MSTPTVSAKKMRRYAAVFTRAASTSAIVVGATGLTGWLSNVDFLRSVYPGLIVTTANSSFALVLTGIALRLVTGPSVKATRRVVATACIGVMLGFAIGSLIEYLTGQDLGIDEILFHRAAGAIYPVRMAPISSVNLTLVGTAILMFVAQRGIRVAQIIGLTSSVVGTLAITGYVFLIPSLYGPGTYTAMSAQMAVMSAVLGFGVLCAHPERGLMSLLAEPTAGGIVARRLLPFALSFPALVIAVFHIERAAGVGRTPFGAVILVFLTITIYTAPILWTASLLYRTDKKRSEAEAHIVEQYAVIKRLNRELQMHVSKLEVSNKELEAFSYSVSHDLRAPLRHIAGFAELLMRHASGKLDSEGNRYLNVISEACAKMDALVNDLLSFSRMGRGELHQTPIELNQMVQQIIGEITGPSRDSRIAWVIHPLPEIEGDPPMIRIALTNYISNAVKYSHKSPNPRIEIGGVESDSRITIFVKDNGAGFDMKYVGKLFGVFQRLHREDEFPGTGIGLATTRRIISRHGGETWAEGVSGQGAVFYFSLPTTETRGAVDEFVTTHSVG